MPLMPSCASSVVRRQGNLCKTGKCTIEETRAVRIRVASLPRILAHILMAFPARKYPPVLRPRVHLGHGALANVTFFIKVFHKDGMQNMNIHTHTHTHSVLLTSQSSARNITMARGYRIRRGHPAAWPGKRRPPRRYCTFAHRARDHGSAGSRWA